MTQEDSGYELRPSEPKPPAPVQPMVSSADASPAGSGAAPKPGEPGWVPPVPVVEYDAPDGAALDPDVEKHKGIAVLAYICFLIPLVVAPNSRFARYHGNQGLLLFILLVVVCLAVALLQGAMVVAAWALKGIPTLNGFFACGLTVLQPALLVGWIALMIMGIINAANGLRKPLPAVGHWELIK